ncbi:MAG TPA: hypothetical protein VFW80_01320 [Gaiellaceae bacterium]|nr:hypothetical protein [Gaiellaceae bacterium]
MKSLRAGGLMLATVITLSSAQAALADDGGSEPTNTDSTTTGRTTTPLAEPTPEPWAETATTRRLKRRAIRYKRTARRLSRLVQRERPQVGRSKDDFDTLLTYRRWLRNAWRRQAKRAKHRAHHPPHRGAWKCIHQFEGPWDDPNAPYYGGLQMDLDFQRAYGLRLLRHKGTADRWAPFEQMWIAERALADGRGFYPWPLTASRCGLI